MALTPELSKHEPKPETFVQYVCAGQAMALTNEEVYSAVEKIAEGVLRLVTLAGFNMALTGHAHSHRRVIRLLEGSTAPQACYKLLICRFAIKKRTLTRDSWEKCWRGAVQEIAESIIKAPLSTREVSAFMEWRGKQDLRQSLPVAHKSRDNIYRYPLDAPKVQIRLGSIHSMKGETHTATLVLETFWNRHNIEKLLPWLNGSESGSGAAGKQQTTRLKLHYVAMTRATHLLCLAMKRTTFENRDGDLDRELVAKVERRGWHIEMVEQSAHHV
jgi:hypothetical protein